MSMSDVEMWEKAVRWTLWCLMRQDLRQWSSDPQVQNLQTLKKSTDILKHGESVFAPLNPVLSKNRNMPFFATYSNPPKFSLDALTTLASKHLTICEQSIVFCEAKLPLLMGNYVLEATDTMQMAFVPWFSRSMAVNSGKAFHTYDICQSALRLRRFERERERLKGHDESLSMLRYFEYVESLCRSEWPRWKTALPKLATASLVLFKSVLDPIGLCKQLNAANLQQKLYIYIYYILPLLHTECFIMHLHTI